MELTAGTQDGGGSGQINRQLDIVVGSMALKAGGRQVQEEALTQPREIEKVPRAKGVRTERGFFRIFGRTCLHPSDLINTVLLGAGLFRV